MKIGKRTLRGLGMSLLEGYFGINKKTKEFLINL